MNPMELLKNFKDIQANMAKMQEKLKNVSVIGSSGGGMVQVAVNGSMEITKVTIEKDAVDPDDIGMLEDLILAASRDAFSKLKEKIGSEMSGLTGGLGIPPGMMGL